jgi:hypothetical protein
MNQTQFITLPPLPPSPFVIQYGDDPIIHTVEHPFCSDSSCPCHDGPDAQKLTELIRDDQIGAGLALRIYWNQ